MLRIVVITKIWLLHLVFQIPGIQDVGTKQNCINHLERLDNNRLPKHALNYKPRGRRNRGYPRKRWQRVNAGTGQHTQSMEEDDDDDDDDDKFTLCQMPR